MPVTIDAAWLADTAHGDPVRGWILAGAGASYRLATDVTSERTAFSVVDPDITLDLNGHAVTFGEADPLLVPNGLFDADPAGSATASGWDLSGAPDSTFECRVDEQYFVVSRMLYWEYPAGLPATIAPGSPAVVTTAAPHGLAPGEAVFLYDLDVRDAAGKALIDPLRMPLAATVTGPTTFTVPLAAASAPAPAGTWQRAQRIRSSPIAVPEAGRTYTASIATAKRGYGSRATRVVLDAEDAGTGLPLTNWSRHIAMTEQGESAVVTFLPTAAEAPRGVRLVVTLVPTGDPDRSRRAAAALARAVVARSNDYGILGMGSGSGSSLAGTVPVNGNGVNATPPTGAANLPASVASGNKFNRAAGLRVTDSTCPRAASVAVNPEGTLGAVAMARAGSGRAVARPVFAPHPGAYRDGAGALREGRRAVGVEVLDGTGGVAGVAWSDPGAGYDAADPPGVYFEPLGRIVQGRSAGAYGKAVMAGNPKSITVEDVAIDLLGDDCMGVTAGNQVGFADFAATDLKRVYNVRVAWPGSGPDTTIRENQLAAVNVIWGASADVRGVVVASNPHMGIVASARNPGSDGSLPTATVEDCRLDPNLVHTNGYSCWLGGSRMRCTRVEIASDRSGRGVYLEADSGVVDSDIEIRNCRVDLCERANREYGTDLAARAFRIRNLPSGAGFRDVRVHRNVGVGRARAGGYADRGIGLRLHLKNGQAQMDDAGLAFRDNIFEGLAMDADGALSGFGLVVDGCGAGIRPLFEGNVLASNDTCLQLSYDDSGPNEGALDVALRRSVLRRSAAGAAMPDPRTYGFGFYGTGVRATILSSSYEGGASEGSIRWRHASAKDVAFGWSAAVHVVDGAGADVAGASVTIRDASGAAVASGVTGPGGLFRCDLVEARFVGPGTAPPASTPGPHALSVAAAGLAPVVGRPIAASPAPLTVALAPLPAAGSPRRFVKFSSPAGDVFLDVI